MWRWAGLFLLCDLFQSKKVVGVDSYEGVGEKCEDFKIFKNAIRDVRVENGALRRMSVFDVADFDEKCDIVISMPYCIIFFVSKSQQAFYPLGKKSVA
jgi:hypothetical protein